MRISKWLGVAVAAIVLGGCTTGSKTETRFEGAAAKLGNGTVSSYGLVDANNVPMAIGITFLAGTLDALPTEPSDLHHCFDANGDGKQDILTDCILGHEKVIPLPSELARRADLPFKWALLNWNPNGHIPPGVYDVPHFDVHFYIEPIENIFALQRGTCGEEFLRCDQFAIATKPLPSNYIHPDFKSVGAASPAMGDHLIDLTGGEFNGQPFTRSWIYGAYDGKIIFYEEMLTREYLLSQPDNCSSIKQPAAVAIAGYYPTQSCVHYDANRKEHTVSIEQFEHREASPPGS